MKQPQSPVGDHAPSSKEASHQSGKSGTQNKKLPFFTRMGRNIASIFHHSHSSSSREKSSLKEGCRRTQSVGDLLSEDTAPNATHKSKSHLKKDKKSTEKVSKSKHKKSAKATPETLSPTGAGPSQPTFPGTDETKAAEEKMTTLRPFRSMDDLLLSTSDSAQAGSLTPRPTLTLTKNATLTKATLPQAHVELSGEMSMEEKPPLDVEAKLSPTTPMSRSSTLNKPAASPQPSSSPQANDFQTELERKLFKRRTVLQECETHESPPTVPPEEESSGPSTPSSTKPGSYSKAQTQQKGFSKVTIPAALISLNHKNPMMPPATRTSAIITLQPSSPSADDFHSASTSPSVIVENETLEIPSPVEVREKLGQDDFDGLHDQADHTQLRVDHSIAKMRISMAASRKGNRRTTQDPNTLRPKTASFPTILTLEEDQENEVKENLESQLKQQNEARISPSNTGHGALIAEMMKKRIISKEGLPKSSSELSDNSNGSADTATKTAPSTVINKTSLVKANSALYSSKSRPTPFTIAKPSPPPNQDISNDDALASAAPIELRKQENDSTND